MDTTSLILTLLNLKGWGAKRVHDYVLKNGLNYEKCVANLVTELDDSKKIQFKNELLKAKSTIKVNLEKGIKICTIFDKEFPKKLYYGNDKCVFLYYVGNIELLSKKAIAIIGTRNPDPEFIEKGKIASSYFAKKGYVIVSGLALGCDTVAHQSCLEVGGQTIAILPSPCDNPQPSSNKLLAQQIVENGGLLISEYGTGTPVNKFNYPQRDRIQNLLSSVVFIIQASNNSGTMIATKKAHNDNKPIFAIKGNSLPYINGFVDVDDDSLQKVENWI